MNKRSLLSTDAYLPGTQLREFIIARDVTCRFPTCQQPASRSQLDHIIPFNPNQPAAAQTHEHNLHVLCARHHQLKTDRIWAVARDPATGQTHWTSPLGRTYTKDPEPLATTRLNATIQRTLTTTNAKTPASETDANSETDPDPP